MAIGDLSIFAATGFQPKEIHFGRLLVFTFVVKIESLAYLNNDVSRGGGSVVESHQGSIGLDHCVREHVQITAGM